MSNSSLGMSKDAVCTLLANYFKFFDQEKSDDAPDDFKQSELDSAGMARGTFYDVLCLRTAVVGLMGFDLSKVNPHSFVSRAYYLPVNTAGAVLYHPEGKIKIVPDFKLFGRLAQDNNTYEKVSRKGSTTIHFRLNGDESSVFKENEGLELDGTKMFSFLEKVVRTYRKLMNPEEKTEDKSFRGFLSRINLPLPICREESNVVDDIVAYLSNGEADLVSKYKNLVEQGVDSNVVQGKKITSAPNVLPLVLKLGLLLDNSTFSEDRRVIAYNLEFDRMFDYNQNYNLASVINACSGIGSRHHRVLGVAEEGRALVKELLTRK